ncbi:MAG: glycosyltransferase family 4 protein [Promethearchaeota archaeon]
MKICYLARAKQLYFVRWYEYFINHGHEVHVISGDDSLINVGVEMPTGVNVHYIPEKKLRNQVVSFGYNLLRLPLIIKELKKITRQISPDVIHAHQITPSGLWAAVSNYHPFIMTPMGSDVLVHARENFIYRLITRYVFSKADLITSDSIILQEAILELGGRHEKNYIIQNGVDFKVFNPNVDGSNIRKKLGLGNSPVILSTRGIAPLYNIDCIVKAIPKVLESLPDAQFLFTYIKEDSISTVKELVKKLGFDASVKFIGCVDHKEIPFYHAAADILVSVPSSDSSPCSVYEAMACGTPVVISDLPWTKHFMKNRENAMIVPVKRSEAIAGAILDILHNHELKSKLTGAGLSTVRRYVDYQKNMEMMENLMENIIRKTRL